MKKHKTSFIGNFVLLLNMIFVFALLISYCASYVSPEKIWIIAFFGLAYPILFLANLFFVILWLFLGKGYFIISLLVILLGWNHITDNIQFYKKHKSNNSNHKFKLMSYNVMSFDYVYNRHKKQNENKFLDFIKKENPDIICFQEYFQNDRKKDNYIDKANKLYNNHIDLFKTKRNACKYGMATFSKFPIVNKGRIQFYNSAGNYCIYSDIVFDKDTIRIFNVHFESIHFNNRDYSFVSEITSVQKQKKDLKKGSKYIYWKLKSAFKKRAEQVLVMIKNINKSPYPVIVCGDFNDTPDSYIYHLMTKNLKDSFIGSGNGLGITYAGNFPYFRIDYILYGKQFKSSNFKTYKIKLSDHYPISSYLNFNH